MQTSRAQTPESNTHRSTHSHLIPGPETMTSKSDDNTAANPHKEKERGKGETRDLESRRASALTSKEANPDER